MVETNGQKTDSNDDIDAVLESMNPQNDWIASLNSARRDKLLSKIDVSGIEITDQIPELGIIRFSVTESRKALPLLNDLIEQEKLSFNSPLHQPLSPRKEEIFDSLEFWILYRMHGRFAQKEQFGQGIKVMLLDSGVKIIPF